MANAEVRVLLETCLLLAFAAHLLAVNVAMGGPLACVGLEWRAARRNDAAAGRLARLLARYSLLALVLGIALGVLMLAAFWFSPRDRYFAALRAIPESRLWFGLGELVFYFACLGGYLALSGRGGRYGIARAALAIFAATNLMLHFPPLFTIIATLARRGELLGTVLDRPAYYRLLLDQEVMSRVLHFWLASLAVAGTLVMACALRMDRAENGADPGHALAGWGSALALVPTLLQLPVGVWVLWQLPPPARESLLGGDVPATLLFMVALVAALRLMHQLASVALGDTDRRQIVGTLSSMLLVVVLMVAAWARCGG